MLVYYSGSINKQYYLYELLTAFLHTNSETHVMMYTFPKLEKPICIIFLYSRYRQYGWLIVVVLPTRSNPASRHERVGHGVIAAVQHFCLDCFEHVAACVGITHRVMENLFRDWDLLVVYSFLEIFRSFLAATVLRESLHLASALSLIHI